ncbi:MAG TPA: sigma-54-dependent Fis family transcriptional regulator [Prolixibacteraceae bacterium]|jgi:two-component system response regulator HydG|nr:sigma-54-dependent Fis family transcriptional regulator [Prolixibacteraceae bacterium]
MANILIVDDDVTFCLMLKKLLEKHQYHVTTLFSAEDVKKTVRQRFYEVVLTDLRMPDVSGMDLIGIIKQESPETQIIMMTGYANISTAIQSIKQGAFNYIPKPFQPEEVLNMIREALEEEVKKREVKNLKTSPRPSKYLEGISKVSKRLKEMMTLVAPTSLSVLITGESGTGKENIARSIHALSACAHKPFVAVDCGAIPKELVASEFFGHVKGSFTGAIADKIGHFEAANGGTLFLDEIGNLSYDTQIQLLRTLQERLIRPVGSNREIYVNVRIIAATNENLQLKKEQGSFREDLYHRLNEFQIEVPSLRERREDILLFAHHFLNESNADLNKSVMGFDAEVEAVFMNYAWPGNLREMKNVVKRATLLATGPQISLNEIPSEIYHLPKDEDQFQLFNEKNEDELIRKVLETVGYNKSKAARLLKIDRKTLYNKLKLYQIEVPEKINSIDSND